MKETFSKEEVDRIIRGVENQTRDSVLGEVFKKFDEFSCVKDDDWYLEWKKKELKQRDDGK